MAAPFLTQWTGEAFKPIGRNARDCISKLTAKKMYRLEIVEERSQASHNFQFAWLADAWRNLPEDLADMYPTPEHLRKRALIQAGYFDETIIDTGNRAGALRVASAWRAKHDFALVIVRGTIVIVREAKSQSRRAMKGGNFEASKTAIMAIIAEMIGVTPEELERNAGVAA